MFFFLVCVVVSKQAAASHGGFGAGGLAFQLRCGDEEDSDGDYVDHDLISVRGYVYDGLFFLAGGGVPVVPIE